MLECKSLKALQQAMTRILSRRNGHSRLSQCSSDELLDGPFPLQSPAQAIPSASGWFRKPLHSIEIEAAANRRQASMIFLAA
jgi:hypothetical protein